MANMGTPKLLVAISLMIMLAMAWGPMQGSCSKFIAWAGPECNNLARKYSACGCSNVAADTHGGYRFTYQGQTAAAYNTKNCQGVAHTRFTSNAEGCSPFGWQSFFIQC